jgi:thymidylate synthase
MTNIKNSFENANEAYRYLLDKIIKEGVDFDNTKALFNVGFEIENPLDNHITDLYRKWNPNYAMREWLWYLSGDPSAIEISKYAPIWKNMMDENGEVRSNYGWQWKRSNQLEKVIKLLQDNPSTRKATISIYDGKEIDMYSNDTPCTYAVQFTVLDGKLNMSVLMRSNDLWYGFCNDQFCFSMLQKHVADTLQLEVGTYYHFAHNLHLYNDKLKT